MTDRDELRQAVARALCAADYADPDAICDNHLHDCPGPAWRLWRKSADAAIAAYEAHRPRPAVVLTREEWDRSITWAVIEWHTVQGENDEAVMTAAIRAAFPWIRVEGE